MEGINMQKFSILWQIMYYKVTLGLSLEDVTIELRKKYNPNEVPQKSIKKLYTLADEVEIKCEYSNGFKEFISDKYLNGKCIDSAISFKSYKSIRRYWLIVGYIFNTPSDLDSIWQYLLEDGNISLDTTHKFIEKMALCSDFITKNGNKYCILFNVENNN